jgi:CheY-like chemotaxis protein/CheY-specific phosphatase CheX
VTVLIVDDESTSRLLLARVISRQFGCQVVEASNGQEALERLAQQPFDFVLLDLMMPVMDGAQTLEVIRQHEALRQLPVIILSAVTEDAAVRRILRLGVSDYLAKPLHPVHIVQRLSRFVETWKGQQAVAAPHAAVAVEATPVEPAAKAGPAAPGADGSIDPRVEIVVADGDGNFRTFVRGLLGHDYRIIEAETGAKALRRCLDAMPAMVLLGDDLGAVSRSLLVRKLRSAHDLRNTRVVAIAPPARVDAVHAEGIFDMVLPRTLAAAAFREQFARAAQSLQSWRGSGELVAGVRLQLVSTVEQVFGMMLGTEVEVQAAHPQIPGVWIHATIDLTLLHEDFTFTVACSCPADTGTRIATQMQKLSTDWVGNDLAAAALGDIAAIIAERMQRTLADQGRRTQSSAAAVRREPMKQKGEGQLLMLSFDATSGSLPFRVAVNGRPKEAAAGTLAHAARKG